MLIDVLRVMVNNLFKKNYCKKKINVLSALSISHKSDIKIFLN